MKTITMTALALVGASFIAIPSFGSSLHPAMDQVAVSNAAEPSPGLVLVTSKKVQVKQNFASKNGYIPGYVWTPYGRADCIGSWYRDKYGEFHCRGQLIPYRY